MMRNPTYFCSFCSSGFSGENARLRRDSCEDLETPDHKYEVGDELEGISDPSERLIILGKTYQRPRTKPHKSHTVCYRVIENGETELHKEEYIDQHYILPPKLQIFKKP